METLDLWAAQANIVNTPKSSLTECRRLMLSMFKRMTVNVRCTFLYMM